MVGSNHAGAVVAKRFSINVFPDQPVRALFIMKGRAGTRGVLHLLLEVPYVRKASHEVETHLRHAAVVQGHVRRPRRAAIAVRLASSRRWTPWPPRRRRWRAGQHHHL